MTLKREEGRRIGALRRGAGRKLLAGDCRGGWDDLMLAYELGSRVVQAADEMLRNTAAMR